MKRPAAWCWAAGLESFLSKISYSSPVSRVRCRIARVRCMCVHHMAGVPFGADRRLQARPARNQPVCNVENKIVGPDRHRSVSTWGVGYPQIVERQPTQVKLFVCFSKRETRLRGGCAALNFRLPTIMHRLTFPSSYANSAGFSRNNAAHPRNPEVVYGDNGCFTGLARTSRMPTAR